MGVKMSGTNVEEISFQIILHGGDARSHAIEAIHHAKSKNLELADESIEKANEALKAAHKYQTELIQGEARGEKADIKILLIHAQDHLMNAMTVRDLAKEIIDVYKYTNGKTNSY